MPSLERLVEVWAAASDGRGVCGSGWVVGDSGVLSCRHLVVPHPAVLQVRSAGAPTATAWVDADVVWSHPSLDLVLLRITPTAAQSWEIPHEPISVASVGTQPGAAVALGFPESERQSIGLRDTEQAAGTLLPLGRRRRRGGLLPLDVDTSVPDDATLWAGFSGSAVHDDHDRLVAIVAEVSRTRQQRRLFVAPVADAITDPGFGAAASAVGFEPVVEVFNAAKWRAAVDPRSLTPEGTPRRVAETAALQDFGAHRQASIDENGGYLAYVARDPDASFDELLSAAIHGGRRVLLVVGDSAAGKTRSAAEAVRRHPALSRWALVSPLADGGLTNLVDGRLALERTLLWLDDLDKFLARGLDIAVVRRLLASTNQMIVVATIRSSQLRALQGNLADPAWRFLTDDDEVARVDLSASMSDAEVDRARASINDPTLIRALAEGVGLGEWLVSGPELTKRLEHAEPLHRAFVETIIAWYRTGLDHPLPQDDALKLWLEICPGELGLRLRRRTSDEIRDLLRSATSWACEPVLNRALYEHALVADTERGYVPHDYVMDYVVRSEGRLQVPDAMWSKALEIAASDTSLLHKRCWVIGVAAHNEGALEHSLAANRTLAEHGDRTALYNVGFVLSELGRLEDALDAYVVLDEAGQDDDDPEVRFVVASALVNRGLLLGRLGLPAQEMVMYEEVDRRFGRSTEHLMQGQVAMALVNKGIMLIEGQQLDEAIGVNQDVVDRFGSVDDADVRDQVARALVNVSSALGDAGRHEESLDVGRELIQRIGGDRADERLELHLVRGRLNEAISLVELKQPEEALAVIDAALEFHQDLLNQSEPDLLSHAWHVRAQILGRLGRFEEKIQQCQVMLDRFGDDHSVNGAEAVSSALISTAAALGRLGRHDDELDALDSVIALERPADALSLRRTAARATNARGRVLARLGRMDEEIATYEGLIRAFGADDDAALRAQVSMAYLRLGTRLDERGRLSEALDAYERASRHDPAPSTDVGRQAKANAEMSRAALLARMGRAHDALAVFGDVVAAGRGVGTLDPTVIRAQVGMAVVHGILGDTDHELDMYEAIVTDHDDNPRPEIRAAVAQAYVSRAFTLRAAGRTEEALASAEEVVRRYGGDREDDIEACVATARELIRALSSEATE